METASENLEFERAAEIRDQIHYVEMTVEKQKSLVMIIHRVIYLLLHE